jgi:hypothetical protein
MEVWHQPWAGVLSLGVVLQKPRFTLPLLNQKYFRIQKNSKQEHSAQVPLDLQKSVAAAAAGTAAFL